MLTVGKLSYAYNIITVFITQRLVSFIELLSCCHPAGSFQLYRFWVGLIQNDHLLTSRLQKYWYPAWQFTLQMQPSESSMYCFSNHRSCICVLHFTAIWLPFNNILNAWIYEALYISTIDVISAKTYTARADCGVLTHWTAKPMLNETIFMQYYLKELLYFN